MFKSEILSIENAAKDLEKSIKGDLINIIAFGSRVRGDFSEDSDLDMLIIVKDKTLPALSLINDVFYREELKNDIPYSITIIPEKAWEKNKRFSTGFYLNIKKEGKVFYGPNL